MKSRRFENVCANYALSAADGGIDTADLQKLAKSKGIDYKTLSRHQLLHVLCGHKAEDDNIAVADVYKPLLKTPIIDMLIRNNRVAGGVPGLTAVVHNILKQYYSATAVHLPKRLWTVDALAIVDYWLLSVDKYIVEYMMYGNPKHGAMLGAYGRLPSITLFDKPPEVQRRIIDDLPAYTDLLNRAFNSKYAYKHVTDEELLFHGAYYLSRCLRRIGNSDFRDNITIVHLEGYVSVESGLDEGMWIVQLNQGQIILNIRNGMVNGKFLWRDEDGNIIVSGMFKDSLMDGTWTAHHSRDMVHIYNISRNVIKTTTVRHASGILLEEQHFADELSVYVHKRKFWDAKLTNEWWYNVDSDQYITGTHRHFADNGQIDSEIIVDEKAQLIIVKQFWGLPTDGIYEFKDGKLKFARPFNIEDADIATPTLMKYAQLIVFMPSTSVFRMRGYFDLVDWRKLGSMRNLLLNKPAWGQG